MGSWSYLESNRTSNPFLGLLDATGARMRHVKIRLLADARQPAVRELIRAALEQCKKVLGL